MDTNETPDGTEQEDLPLLLSFASRHNVGASGRAGVGFSGESLAGGGARSDVEPLIEKADLAEFADAAYGRFSRAERGEVLRRALGFAVPVPGESLERSFLVLFSSLEAALTFARGEDEYEIVPRAEFTQLERDLKNWLRRHPALSDDAARRALVYEKTRELNRLPFSRVFEKFRERHGVELSDLWPLTGRLDSWPLLEIRHRLVHGDPFGSRPDSALSCARAHLRWTAERMLLALLGWPVERSNVSPERLARSSEAYVNWSEERARLA